MLGSHGKNLQEPDLWRCCERQRNCDNVCQAQLKPRVFLLMIGSEGSRSAVQIRNCEGAPLVLGGAVGQARWWCYRRFRRKRAVYRRENSRAAAEPATLTWNLQRLSLRPTMLPGSLIINSAWGGQEFRAPRKGRRRCRRGLPRLSAALPLTCVCSSL